MEMVELLSLKVHPFTLNKTNIMEQKQLTCDLSHHIFFSIESI